MIVAAMGENHALDSVDLGSCDTCNILEHANVESASLKEQLLAAERRVKL